MSFLPKLLAKSPDKAPPLGETLTDHLTATLAAAVRLRDRVGRVPILPDRFWAWVFLAALLHDCGKIPDGFQIMLTSGARWGERHEVYSLGFVARILAGLSDEDRAWVATGVVTHHRALTDERARSIYFLYPTSTLEEFTARFGRVDENAATELLTWLATTAHAEGLLPAVPETTEHDLGADAYALLEELRKRWEFGLVDAETGRTAVLLQGAVTFADHVSSAHGELRDHQPIDATFGRNLTTKLDLYAHQVEAAAVDGHLLLRAPTGTGKTEAMLLWVVRQVAALRATNGGQPRAFDMLPYLASINAMALRLVNDCGLGDDDVGIVHSRAASFHLSRSIRSDDESIERTVRAADKAVSRAAATRLFREPVRVGTPYQLLRGALAGPAHSGILIDSANSVFVLDELHAYDARQLGMVLAMLGFWEKIGGRIGVMSATLPHRLADLLDQTLEARLHRVEALDGDWPVRHHLSLRTEHLTTEGSIEEITARLRTGQSVLVVANNVADARTLFEALAPTVTERYGPDAAILSHARFRAKDRSRSEEEIRQRFGTHAPRRPGLLVATQTVEVSLDVDFDVIHTSGAPLDALIQRFGRVNRRGQRPPADVVVHAPGFRTRRDGGQRLWADGVYEEEPTRLTMSILERADGTLLDERTTGDWLDELYDSEWGERWQTMVTRIRDEFAEVFLSFAAPFDDRSDLADRFDEMFDGVDAVLDDDLDNYIMALTTAEGPARRLLGAQYLIPLPRYARPLGRYDKDLKVTVIDADYDKRLGLGAIHRVGGYQYQLDEVL